MVRIRITKYSYDQNSQVVIICQKLLPDRSFYMSKKKYGREIIPQPNLPTTRNHISYDTCRLYGFHLYNSSQQCWTVSFQTGIYYPCVRGCCDNISGNMVSPCFHYILESLLRSSRNLLLRLQISPGSFFSSPASYFSRSQP